jgi:hypothetical protein
VSVSCERDPPAEILSVICEGSLARRSGSCMTQPPSYSCVPVPSWWDAETRVDDV